MEEAQCALGCKLFLQFLSECPEVKPTLDPNAHTIVSGECVQRCLLFNYAPGMWWYFTNFTNYFACLDENKQDCDFWKIKRLCVHRYDGLAWGIQLVSAVSCVIVLARLYRDVKRGWFQLALFLSLTHHLIQCLFTEEAYNVWAEYIMPKNTPSTMGAITMRYMHTWYCFTGLLWSIVAAIALLRIISGSVRGVSCVRFVDRYKKALVVIAELACIGMTMVSIVARYYAWREFFDVLLIVCLVFLGLGVLCYAFTLMKARRMQLIVREMYAQRQRANGSRRERKRLQMLPFWLMLGTLFLSFFPYILIQSLPMRLTLLTDRLSWMSVDMVGVWNLLGLGVGMFVTMVVNKNANSKVHALLRNNSLVKKNNACITGTHAFSRSKPDGFWRVSPEIVPFGTSCRFDGEDRPLLMGDIEQSPEGALIRWTKRPSKNPQHSVVAAGLPLEKFQLFIDTTFENLFPKEDLLPVTGGFCLAIRIAPLGHEAHHRQLGAIREFEEAALHCKGLWGDHVMSMHDSRGRKETRGEGEEVSTPRGIVQEPLELLEQAQKDWAFQEARFKLASSVQAVLRCRRVSDAPTIAPQSLSDPDLAERDHDGSEPSSNEEWKYSEPSSS